VATDARLLREAAAALGQAMTNALGGREALGALRQRRLDDRRHLRPGLLCSITASAFLASVFLARRARGVERLARLAAVAVERDGLEAELPALV
jgi:hypothetical protein